MDRSLAGRFPIARPFAPAAPRRAGRSSAGRGGARSPDGRLRLWWRPFAALADLTRACFVFIWRRRRARIALIAVLAALGPLAGGWLWLRDSSLVSVEHVRLSGVHGPDVRAIEAALTGAARHMSTLDVRPGALRAAVAPFRVVREVQTSPSFPHGLRIHVIEQLPVAVLTVDGARTAVAADGVVLGPALLSSSLPAVSDSATPQAQGGELTGQHVRGASLLADLTVLGAAPASLEKVVARVYTGPMGLTVAMRNGLLAYFGDATLPHAKWISLARVLADPSSAGASYVDVRLPERPAAGFADGVAPATSSATGTPPTGTEPGSAADPTTAAELAAGLTAALSGGSTASGSTASTTASLPTASSPGSSSGHEESSTGSTPSETTSTAPVESPRGAAAEAAAAGATPGG
jgi:cell division protein FtsQ